VQIQAENKVSQVVARAKHAGAARLTLGIKIEDNGANLATAADDCVIDLVTDFRESLRIDRIGHGHEETVGWLLGAKRSRAKARDDNPSESGQQYQGRPTANGWHGKKHAISSTITARS